MMMMMMSRGSKPTFPPYLSHDDDDDDDGDDGDGDGDDDDLMIMMI